jgi:hypothetical protein
MRNALYADALIYPPKAGLDPSCDGGEFTHRACVAQKHIVLKKSLLSKDFTSHGRNFD